MKTVLLVGIGGFCGAIARYLVGTVLPSTVATTLAVNISGSLTLSALVTTILGDPLFLVLGVGFCGAFTTFSWFAVETVGLFENGRRARAATYATGMLVTALAGVFVGGWLAQVAI